MPTAEITVKYCNPKQANKKNASVKTDDGQMYFVTPEMFGQFEVGGKYSVEYKVSEFKGVENRYIEKADKVSGGSPANHAPNPNVHNSMTKAKYGTVDMETAERIFVCGAMNALVGNQNIDPRGLTKEHLIAEVNKLRAVWANTFANPQKDEEIDDEIPFN